MSKCFAMWITVLVACLWLVTSPLGAKIVFYSHRDGNTEIYTMDSDGSNLMRLTFNEVSDSAPAWSPNGQQIAFHTTRDRNFDVYVMDADGSNPRKLTRHPENDRQPTWSPDGSQIAFNSFRAGAINIHVMDADGNNVKQLTHMRIEHWELASKPKWSPDGEWILFGGDIVEGNLKQGRQVYAMRPDGTGRWQVSEPALNASMFLGGWSPDGTQVLYKGTIGGDVKDSFAVIATLNPQRTKVIKREDVPVPKMPFASVSFGADGKSILFRGKRANIWNIYRFCLSDRKLIQLTDNPGADLGPQEWNPRLSVPAEQGLLLQFWGQVKAVASRR